MGNHHCTLHVPMMVIFRFIVPWSFSVGHELLINRLQNPPSACRGFHDGLRANPVAVLALHFIVSLPVRNLASLRLMCRDAKRLIAGTGNPVSGF
jgi:hypothetical protein